MAQQVTLVVFEIGEQRFGLPLEAVCEIIPLVAVSPIPDMPKDWLGIANVRGLATPVIDFRVHLGKANTLPRLSSPLIVIRLENQQAALLVERIEEIRTIAVEQEASAIIHEGKILALIDPNTLLGHEAALS